MDPCRRQVFVLFILLSATTITGYYVCMLYGLNDASRPSSSSDTCDEGSESCQSSQLCTINTSSVDLCIHPCPVACVCDYLNINPPTQYPALVGFTGDLIISNVSSSYSDGCSLVLSLSEFGYVSSLIFSRAYPGVLRLKIEDGAFSSNSLLRLLVFIGSSMEVITNATFKGLSALESLYLVRGNLRVIETAAFDGLENLRSLSLSENAMHTIEPGAFSHLIRLETLSLSENAMHTIEPGAFSHLIRLETLNLENNHLTVIESGTFNGLRNLQSLNLENNHLTVIGSGTLFNGLQNLQSLYLGENAVHTIESGAFSHVIRLKTLFLGGNAIHTIEPGAFSHVIRLKTLYMTGVDYVENFSAQSFQGLGGVESMYVTDFRFCCLVENLGKCVDQQPVRFSSCSGLLSYRALGVFMWILGSLAFFGNAFVLLMRFRSRGDNKGSKTVQIQSFLIMNLATADLLTGLYMLILAAADTAFGVNYFIYASSWRDGLPCQIIGVLAVMSSEASVLILVLITIDRLLVVVFPFGPVHLSLGSVKVWAIIIWIFSSIVGILPPIIKLDLIESKLDYFYIYSDVCLGLPLYHSMEIVSYYNGVEFEPKYKPDGKYPYYAITIFIGLNLLCFLTILFSYVAIFVYASRTARKARRSQERKQELRFAARMALIVGTDFCCWMPIIILGILTQTGAVTVSKEMYAWCVVFIIPINSAVNPFLYTFRETCTKRKGSQTHKRKIQVPSKPDEGLMSSPL